MIEVTQITKAGKLQRMISYGFPRTVYTNYVSKKRVDPGFPVVEQRGFVPKITVTHSISFLSKIRVVFYPGVNSVLAAKRRTETQRISIAIVISLPVKLTMIEILTACAQHVPLGTHVRDLFDWLFDTFDLRY